jgi:hypothetical protein
MNRRRISIPRKETSFCFDLGQPAGECFLMLGETISERKHDQTALSLLAWLGSSQLSVYLDQRALSNELTTDLSRLAEDILSLFTVLIGGSSWPK